MEETNAASTLADACTVSTRSGHPPGSPQPPITPPRRRSSLAFSRVFSSSIPSTHRSDRTKAHHTSMRSHACTPSNTARKRTAASVYCSTPTSGHVAQIQKLFQSAKASLRVDMAFAASPVGSIGSRLPSSISPELKSSPEVEDGEIGETMLAKDWRYSTAPKLIAAVEQDVREPLSIESPTLPKSLDVGADDSPVALEPMSSGFASPVDHKGYSDNEEVDLPPLPMSSAVSEASFDDTTEPFRNDDFSPEQLQSKLEASMSALQVDSEPRHGNVHLSQSPGIVIAKDNLPAQSNPQISACGEDEFFLSDSARAAAESAKAKRGVLRSLFPWAALRKNSPKPNISEEKVLDSSSDVALDRRNRSTSTMPGTAQATPAIESLIPPCPDPSLHRLLEMGKCPDPIAHLRMVNPGPIVHQFGCRTPDPAFPVEQHSLSPDHCSTPVAMLPFHRATATGSPMPFARPRTTPQSPENRLDPRNSGGHIAALPKPFLVSKTRPGTRNGAYSDSNVGMESEHFQPGWYYSREPVQPAKVLNPMTYSFSTAAAKVGGQSAAPDSRIRDSYRTDTLTPLAKPPSRFRKTGAGAFASARGIGKYYVEGDEARSSSRITDTATKSSRRHHESIQFRSSPPQSTASMVPSFQKRRRPKETEDEQFDIREDETLVLNAASPPGRLGASEEVMAVNEDTRPAVDLSMCISDTSDAEQSFRPGIKEISPNVMQVRKRTRQPRKKRRPSYWDGDLKQVRESPAARHVQNLQRRPVESLRQGAQRLVLTNPAKEEVRSMKGEEASTTPEEVEMAEVLGSDAVKENQWKVLPKAEGQEVMEIDTEG